ncbi:hypothetical protein R7D97_20690 [Vibrio sp. Vb5031]|jgi:hypothetical protein|uniref:Uncharacterized protein n=2 Tax=Vibrio harveyi group TaxID=717610 RepID=A0AA47JN29_VIBPH|nr:MULTISPECIES: hypothetical protein [Vibrio]OOH98715.1 hypothetical protein BIW16_18600 [Vibrio sp. OULL4]CAH1592833.1 conserved hypothetical protein [Vibrio jasicida]GHX44101.1 hypothetical protein VCSRO205_3211 [Vibrio cholerae]EGR3502835.1 hypothetical protein [Vibrio parahaemolyticus]ELA8176454.1 hypothetical protein [Vibrio alginolyticus]
MRYLLTTGHRIPKFYKTDGSIVEVELNYVENKTVSSIDEHGGLSHVKIGGTPPCVGNVWLVDSVEESLHKLEANGVYPFITKAAARENAKRLELKTFKYIAVP